uniref:NADH dehydrogenase subunit 6 n=1 Tax=Piesma cf. maculatum TaxID=2931304 RepID=A0A8T9ZWK9_9HEMI|nr:NADH dehydrogenase subunit 6 [Piesma cf. maculatum]
MTMMNSLLALSFLFMWINHPIAMGILIIIQTLLVALIAGMMMKSFWFSYIIMIIMISGMLVLFIYMASIASNEKFFLSFKLMMVMIVILMFMEDNSDMDATEEISTPYINISLMKLFNNKSMFITLMLVNYLFYAMMTVSKIVHIYEGPLRIKK